MPVKDWNVWVNLSGSTAESVKRVILYLFSVSICVQYFSPYVSADMNKMAQAFNTTVAALEDELTQLILEGLINARIDSHSKVTRTSFTTPAFQFLRKSPQSWYAVRFCTRGTWTRGAPHLRSRSTWAKSSRDEPKPWSSGQLCCAIRSTLRWKKITCQFICLRFGFDRTAVGNISVFQPQIFEKFPYRDKCRYRNNFTPKVNSCNTDVVSTFQSPPREGSQGELAPANSQTRMSTNMWGRCRHQRLHADPADSISSPEGSSNTQPLSPPPFVSLQQTEGTKLQWLYCPDTIPAAPLHDRGGDKCFVLSSDLENWKCVLMNSALQLYV